MGNHLVREMEREQAYLKLLKEQAKRESEQVKTKELNEVKTKESRTPPNTPTKNL